MWKGAQLVNDETRLPTQQACSRVHTLSTPDTNKRNVSQDTVLQRVGPTAMSTRARGLKQHQPGLKMKEVSNNLR